MFQLVAALRIINKLTAFFNYEVKSILIMFMLERPRNVFHGFTMLNVQPQTFRRLVVLEWGCSTADLRMVVPSAGYYHPQVSGGFT